MTAGGEPLRRLDHIRVDIEPLLCFLEAKGRGTWDVFQAALGAVVSAPHSPYDIADRLAAQAFFEVDWRDDRSWQVCQPVLVERLGSQAAILDEGDVSTERSISESWTLFGASAATSSHVLAGAPEASYVIRNVSVDAGRSVRLEFRRAVLVDRNIASSISRSGHVASLSAADLCAYLDLLPDIEAVAGYWKDESEKREADFVRLEEAYQTEYFRAESGSWDPRPFDGSFGMWRAEGKPRRYFFVVAPYTGSGAARTFDYFQVPRDLGSWFAALANGSSGTAKISRNSRTLEIGLAPGLFDLPVLYERWLALWGCRRFVLRRSPKTLRFMDIDEAQATIFARRLHLKLEL